MPKSDHKRTSSKHKIDRRLGVNLWGRPKSPLNDREYAPGQHGQRRKKPTDYGVQLMARVIDEDSPVIHSEFFA